MEKSISLWIFPLLLLGACSRDPGSLPKQENGAGFWFLNFVDALGETGVTLPRVKGCRDEMTADFKACLRIDTPGSYSWYLPQMTPSGRTVGCFFPQCSLEKLRPDVQRLLRTARKKEFTPFYDFDILVAFDRNLSWGDFREFKKEWGWGKRKIQDAHVLVRTPRGIASFYIGAELCLHEDYAGGPVDFRFSLPGGRSFHVQGHDLLLRMGKDKEGNPLFRMEIESGKSPRVALLLHGLADLDEAFQRLMINKKFQQRARVHIDAKPQLPAEEVLELLYRVQSAGVRPQRTYLLVSPR